MEGTEDDLSSAEHKSDYVTALDIGDESYVSKALR